LWRTDTAGATADFVQPFDVLFARTGLLVMDIGDSKLKTLDPRTGSVRAVTGREGSGPGEVRGVVTLFGTSARPMLLEFMTGRVLELRSDGSLIAVPVAQAGQWTTGCSWGEGNVLLAKAGQYFVSEIRPNAMILDSLPMPWPRLRALPYIVRQAGLHQVDDSTCAMLPTFHREFALLSPTRHPLLGLHFEQLPPASADEAKTDAGTIHTIARGAKSGFQDAATWKDAILVSFGGTSRHRRRLLDVFRRTDLSYRGSILLPFEVRRLAIRGDTLAVVGEDDDYPIVAAFLIHSSPTH
jgi:hypothetical protein